jgi:hypothetical protein
VCHMDGECAGNPFKTVDSGGLSFGSSRKSVERGLDF